MRHSGSPENPVDGPERSLSAAALVRHGGPFDAEHAVTSDSDQVHDSEFRTLVRAARAVIAERVHRSVATPSQVLDEMPDADDPVAMRAWVPSSAFRDAVRSVVLSTLELYVGIVDGDNGETMR